MSENDLSALAGLAAVLPQERRDQIEKQLPGAKAPQFEAGLASGLERAASIAAEHSETVGAALREVAAVAAARALAQRELYDQIRRQTDTPEERTEIEALVSRILAGEIEMFPLEDVIREVETLEANRGRHAG